MQYKNSKGDKVNIIDGYPRRITEEIDQYYPKKEER